MTTSSKTTGNGPADGIDPGGTGSTMAHAPDRNVLRGEVESGDRNTLDREDPIRSGEAGRRD